MADLYIPNLHSFAMDNIFTGSCGAFRFRAAPQVVKGNGKEVDLEQSTIVAEYWHGEKCYELSTIEDCRTFPMTEQGRADMKAWLEANI